MKGAVWAGDGAEGSRGGVLEVQGEGIQGRSRGETIQERQAGQMVQQLGDGAGGGRVQ